MGKKAKKAHKKAKKAAKAVQKKKAAHAIKHVEKKILADKAKKAAKKKQEAMIDSSSEKELAHLVTANMKHDNMRTHLDSLVSEGVNKALAVTAVDVATEPAAVADSESATAFDSVDDSENLPAEADMDLDDLDDDM